MIEDFLEEDFQPQPPHRRSVVDEIVSEIVLRGEAYIAVAGVFGIDYRSDVIRIPLTSYRLEQVRHGVSSVSSMTRHIAKFEQYQAAVSRAIRNFHEMKDFEIDFPAVLSILLHESMSPRDLITQAINYRRTRYARSFRKWLIKVDEAVSCDKFNRKILLEAKADFESKLEREEPRNAISATLVPSLTIDPQMLIEPGLDLIALLKSSFGTIRKYLVKPHLVFIENMKKKLDNLESSSKELKRIFGEDLSEPQRKFFAEIDSLVPGHREK